MRITIEPTAEIVAINGELSRIWKGIDDQGVPVEVFVRMVSPQTHDVAVNERYASDLVELGAAKLRRPLTIDFRGVI